MNHLIPRRFQSEAFTLTAIEGPDGPLFAAFEVAAALGYERSSRVANKVREWSDEFAEGDEFVVLTGEEAQFVLGTVAHPAPGSTNMVRRIMLLTEEGLYLFLMKSQAPHAKTFRRWVAHEVLPALRRGDLVPTAAPEEVHEPQAAETLDASTQLALAQLELERERLLSQRHALGVFRDLRLAGKRVPGFVAEAAGRTTRATPREDPQPLALPGPAVAAPQGAEVPEGWFQSALYVLGQSLDASKKKSAAGALLKREAKAMGLWDDDSWHRITTEEFVRHGKRGTTTVHLFRHGFLSELRRRQQGDQGEVPDAR